MQTKTLPAIIARIERNRAILQRKERAKQYASANRTDGRKALYLLG